MKLFGWRTVFVLEYYVDYGHYEGTPNFSETWLYYIIGGH